MTGVRAQTGRFRICWYDEVASTNDLARAAALAGEPQNLFTIARRQTAGRGRHGRTWESPAGNFYGSLLLRPGGSLRAAASLSLVIGLAVAEALHDLSGGEIRARLKWPNDILVDRAKLAGILLEGGEGPDGVWVVAGIGVNLLVAPSGTTYPVTSLAAVGCAGVTPERFLEALAAPLGRRFDDWQSSGFLGQRQSWLDVAAGLGAEVTLRIGGGVHRGRFADLGADGTILLENPDGSLRQFSAGELFFGRGSEPASGRRG